MSIDLPPTISPPTSATWHLLWESGSRLGPYSSAYGAASRFRKWERAFWQQKGRPSTSSKPNTWNVLGNGERDRPWNGLARSTCAVASLRLRQIYFPVTAHLENVAQQGSTHHECSTRSRGPFPWAAISNRLCNNTTHCYCISFRADLTRLGCHDVFVHLHVQWNQASNRLKKLDTV